MFPNVFPIVLAGGSGTRLWPLSRKNFPKQFLTLQEEGSLLQQTMERVAHIPHEHSIVVTGEDHYFLCQEQLLAAQKPIDYLLEPCSKNTAPAIASAAHHIYHTYGAESLLLVLPSDHWIKDVNEWAAALTTGLAYAHAQEVLVTFGITPNSPKTGYGYIEAQQSIAKDVYSIQQFREKPNESLAVQFVEAGNFYWNSGMFIGKAGTFLQECKKHAPSIYDATLKAYQNATKQHDYIRLDRLSYELAPKDSIDFAIMEHTTNAVMVRADFEWNDLGSWTAVAETRTADAAGNALLGNVLVEHTKECFIQSEEILVTAIGLEQQIIVATKDAILVADKQYAEQVKDMVSLLQSQRQHLVDEHVRVSRPWGYYEILASGATFKVKRLMLKPGAKISLQKHEHRSEHWVVVSGVADVVNGEHFIQLQVNESTYIPPKTRHRLSNPGQGPLYVIEVQTGAYLGEDDIVRYEDMYLRDTTIAETCA